MSKNLITVPQLKAILGADNLVLLDASMATPLPGVSNDLTQGFIPGALRFDLEKVFIDKCNALPHTMPDANLFQEEARKLGIDHNSLVVVYDNMGLYSAPRAWWMFRAMGHENVKILDGGLPGWKAQGENVSELEAAPTLGDFQANPQPLKFIVADELLQRIASAEIRVLDARSEPRFKGWEAEPRQGVRSGHMPGAQCLHFRTLTRQGQLKPESELEMLFSSLNLQVSEPLVMTCGSGITACILALAADELGYQDIRVYDGSWAEWGADERLPVVADPK
ncbi:sulfurtransferase [Planctobacterium marinum]|uniref:sulfurtransferase n=1 Tax=Planctobacterium marinum TaxID=1631968 RepID=UPI001E5922F3|nr:sulfurtransferase [Planctobacterium marinum]MCC2605873.1 sulfurtransferase [Planctobacterium marinum]